MPQIDRVNVATLTRLADIAGTHDRLVATAEGGIQTSGRVSAFFTAKATHRATAEAFLGAIRNKYGDGIADALAPQLSAMRQQGKPLKARVARDILAQASNMSQALGPANTEMARRFLLGNNGAGDTRNLDHALQDFYAKNNLQPSPALRQAFERIINDMAANSQKLLSYQDMADAVTMQTLQSRPADYMLCGIDPQLTRDAALDACATHLGVDGELKAQLGQLMDRVLVEESAAGRQGTPADFFRDLSTANQTSLQCFAFACGKPGLGDAALRDVMSLTPHRHMGDMATLAPQLNVGGGIALIMVAMQRLPEIRTRQPQGPLSRETLWQGCFQEPMPQDLAAKSQRDFNSAMYEKLLGMFRARTEDPAAPFTGMLLLGAGVRLEKALEAVSDAAGFDLKDFAFPPSLTPLARLGDMAKVEEGMAMDLNRRGTHNALPGYRPTISFGGVGIPAEAEATVHIQDIAYMTDEDKNDFEHGRPSTMSHNLAIRAQLLCGNNDAQARQVLLSMGQSGAFLVRTLSHLTGVLQDEHSPLDIDIRREANGDVTMRYHTPPQSPLDADFTYTVTPDGQGVLTACRMQARQPQDA
ncbi:MULTISPECIES: hypothetical protein [Desulfovibrio]|uniref:hypothetical protein n=1 Tax=Desulfovibrio TaxID=872 RepID=UPI0026659FD5|nr:MULTISPECIES: hypothetical protein [Desulfovibrio]MDY4939670.1 hypothetical protein [Desulfovibrio sp.]